MKSRCFRAVLVASLVAAASATGANAQTNIAGRIEVAQGTAQPTSKKDDPPATTAATKHVGIVYFSPYRIKFANQYIGVYCVLADGQTAADIASVLAAAGTLGGTIATGATATLLKNDLTAIQNVLQPIVGALAVQLGNAYCYHVKFKDNNLGAINLIYPLTTPAKDNSTLPFATNSYLMRYTASGVQPLTYEKNSRWDTLGIEYPPCGQNGCPCRGQFCQVRSFDGMPTSAEVVAASFCVEAPADHPTESYIISFGAPDKIDAKIDAKKHPANTDQDLGTDFLKTVSKPCAQRGFPPTSSN